MKEDIFKMKNFKDPLKVNFKETTKEVVKGVVTLAIAIPLVVGISSIFGSSK